MKVRAVFVVEYEIDAALHADVGAAALHLFDTVRAAAPDMPPGVAATGVAHVGIEDTAERVLSNFTPPPTVAEARQWAADGVEWPDGERVLRALFTSRLGLSGSSPPEAARRLAYVWAARILGGGDEPPFPGRGH